MVELSCPKIRVFRIFINSLAHLDPGVEDDEEDINDDAEERVRIRLTKSITTLRLLSKADNSCESSSVRKVIEHDSDE